MSMNISNLLSYASYVTRGVTQEARDMAIRNNQFTPGLMNANDVQNIVFSAVRDANAFNNQFRLANPDIPEYKANGFNPPKNMSEYLTGAMDTVRDIQAKIAANPNYKGEKTAATLREEQQLVLMEEQNVVMAKLSESLNGFNDNYGGLSDSLNNVSTQSTEQTSILTSLLDRFESMQEWMINMEQQIANQAATENTET